jgi:hypothetical protein
MNIATLKNLKHPTILHFVESERGHFVIFNAYNDGKFEILDATKDANNGFVQCMKPRALKRVWDGNLMILSNRPISPPDQLSTAQTVAMGVTAGSIVAGLVCLCSSVGGFYQKRTRAKNPHGSSIEKKGAGIRCKVVLLAITLTFLVSSGCRKKPSGPSIVFGAYKYDYGVLPEQERAVEAEFVFRNGGSAPLRIIKAKGECTCRVSVMQLPERDILPGELDKIVLSVAFALREGRQNVTLFVHSNDPEEPVVKLIIAARVQPDIMLNTQSVNLGQVVIGSTSSAEFEIRVPVMSHEQPLDSIELVPSSPMLSTTLLGVTKLHTQLGPIHLLKYQIQLSTEDVFGSFNEVLTVRHKETQATRQVRVAASVIGNVKVEPERLFLGVLDGDQLLSKTVLIKATTGNALEIADVKSTTPDFNAKVTKLSPGSYKLDVVSRLGHIGEGLIEAEIVVFTNDPLQPVVRIPITAYRSEMHD